MKKSTNLNFNTYTKINLKIIKQFIKIFKNIQIKLYGFDIKIMLKKKNIINYLYILKKNSSFLFSVLIDIIVEDFPKKKKRYYIKYFLRSLEYNKILQLIIKTKDYKPVFSIINFYKNAYWIEREAWDLYGIFFLYNRDLRRLLTDYGFRGNPFKKDFPLVGFLEIYFDFFFKKLKYKKVTITQKKQDFYTNKIFYKNIKQI
jgi:NADH-quinone oxidoreductase subunit C